MSIDVDIRKKLGSFALDIRFTAADETLALLGASGCGKSMTLKCIAGIETPDEGRIVVDGITLFDSQRKINLSPQERCVGLMFQNYALFPNMTVLQNIRSGARREKNRKKREENVRQIIESFSLSPVADHYPHQLSGGQQQRVALARILISSPRLLLLDEPFSALDSHLRLQLEQEVRRVIRSFGKTVLLVSHDRDEVYRMSERIAIMNQGRIEACGEKNALFADPQTVNGAIMTGCTNLSPIEVRGEHRIYAMDWGVELSVTHLPAHADYLGIRTHDICPDMGENTIQCDVVDVTENPFSVTVLLRPKGKEDAAPIGWEMDKENWTGSLGDTLKISLPPESLLLLSEMSESEEA